MNTAKSRVYAVFFRPGPRWKSGAPISEQDGIREHPAFLARQFQAGTLVMGGPFGDDSGGLSIFRVEDRETLEMLFTTDQSIVSGLLVPEIHEWHPGFNRYQRDES